MVVYMNMPMVQEDRPVWLQPDSRIQKSVKEGHAKNVM